MQAWLKQYEYGCACMAILVVAAILLVPQVLFRCSAHELTVFLEKLSADKARVADLHTQIWKASLLISGFALLAAAWLAYAWTRGDKARVYTESPIELFLMGVVPLAATLFFGYQVIAGSLFGTVSVTAAAVRCVAAPDRAMLSVKLERGDKWVVEVPLVTYFVHQPRQDGKWIEVAFPRRTKDPWGDEVSWLHLGPGEKIDTMQIIDLPPGRFDTVIDLRADSYAVWWPLPSQALTRVIVPAAEPASAPSSTGCRPPKEAA
jgi:hypothetical protein